MPIPGALQTNSIPLQSYALGESAKFLLMEDCNASFFDVLTPQRICHLGTHVYWLAVLMANMPPAIMIRVIPRVAVFARFMEVCTPRAQLIAQSV